MSAREFVSLYPDGRPPEIVFPWTAETITMEQYTGLARQQIVLDPSGNPNYPTIKGIPAAEYMTTGFRGEVEESLLPPEDPYPGTEDWRILDAPLNWLREQEPHLLNPHQHYTAEEFGDVLWYLTNACAYRGVRLFAALEGLPLAATVDNTIRANLVVDPRLHTVTGAEYAASCQQLLAMLEHHDASYAARDHVAPASLHAALTAAAQDLFTTVSILAHTRLNTTLARILLFNQQKIERRRRTNSIFDHTRDPRSVTSDAG